MILGQKKDRSKANSKCMEVDAGAGVKEESVMRTDDEDVTEY